MIIIKKLIHFQIPTNDKGELKDSLSNIVKFHQQVKEMISKDYVILFSPFEVDIDENIVHIKIDEKLNNRIKKSFYKLIKQKIEKEGYEIITRKI